MDESLEIVNHIYKDSEMAISTLTKLSNTLEKKDNKIKDTVEDIIKGYERYFKDAKKILNKKVIEEIKKLKNKFSLGICVVFKKNSIVIELYNYHILPENIL